MKNIIKSLLVIVAVAAVAGSVTYSIYQDTETSNGNTYTAGTLDLKVNDIDGPITPITASNIYPGGPATITTWTLKNTGSVCGNPNIAFSDLVNYENGQNDAEAAVDSTSGAQQGELGGKMYAMMNWRQNGGSWHSVTLTPPGQAGNPAVNQLNGNSYGASSFPVLCQDQTVDVEFRIWPFTRNDVGNEIQSDSVQFNMAFNLVQVP